MILDPRQSNQLGKIAIQASHQAFEKDGPSFYWKIPTFTGVRTHAKNYAQASLEHI